MSRRGSSPPRLGRRRAEDPVHKLPRQRIPRTVNDAWLAYKEKHGAVEFRIWIEDEYADLLLLRGEVEAAERARGEVEAAEQAKVKATKRHAGKTYENTVKQSAGDENAADELTQDNLA